MDRSCSEITHHSWHGARWTNLGALLKAAKRITKDGRFADGHSLPSSGIDGRVTDGAADGVVYPPN